jgi:hypothetical protein
MRDDPVEVSREEKLMQFEQHKNKRTMIPGWRARPINEGKTDRGASSPANPAV